MKTPRFFSSFLIILFSTVNTIFASDIVFYGIVKQQDWVQTNSSAAVLEAATPFRFTCFVDSQPTVVNSAFVQIPSGGSRTLVAEGDSSWNFEQRFSSLSSLDATYGTGTYSLQVDSQNDFTSFSQLQMSANAYPNTPQLSNFSAAQSINPTNSFTLMWDAFTGGTANDFVQVSISAEGGVDVFRSGDAPGSPSALNGTSTSIDIPANTLSPGQFYTVELMFAKITVSNTTSIPGATGVVAFAKRTKTILHTSGTPPSIQLQVIGFVGGQFQFQFNSVAGKNYQIQWSDNLSGWGNLGFTNATSSQTVFADMTAGAPKRFYRVLGQ